MVISGYVLRGSRWCADDMDSGWTGWFMLKQNDGETLLVKTHRPEVFDSLGQSYERVELEGDWITEHVISKSNDGEKIGEWTYDRFLAVEVL